MIKVMIAEDNISLCKNYFNFFSNDSDIKVVSCTEDGEETIQKYFELQPDVLLLDLNLPKISGLDVINTIKHIVVAMWYGVNALFSFLFSSFISFPPLFFTFYHFSFVSYIVFWNFSVKCTNW